MLTRARLRVRLTVYEPAVVMTRYIKVIILVAVLLAAAVHPAAAQIGLDPVVTAPRSGEVIRGVVAVTGTTDVPGFVSAEVSFAYESDPTGTWFLIAASTQPVSEATLATWDTTTITDETYRLRLRVSMSDGTVREAIVTGLRVRNYTPVETPTLPANAPAPTPLPSATSTATRFPTPTVLPHNPAALTPTDVTHSLLYGGLAAVVIFIVFGLYSLLRRK
jgi:hypothetical protein